MSQIRIEGPYRHRDKWRCRLVLQGRRMWCRPSAPSPEAARAVAEGAARAAAQPGGLTVAAAAADYAAHQHQQGCRPTTVHKNQGALRRFFAGSYQGPLTRLSPALCASLYETLRTRPGPLGRLLAVDSHRNYHLRAKAFLTWCVSQGRLRANPMQGVKPVGRCRRGRKQLRIDEARALWAVGLAEAEQHDAPIPVLIAMSMGLRAGEIVSRTVRDVDDGGRLLWVDYTDDGFAPKTASSRRSVQVPEELQPLLRRLCKDKTPSALLWMGEDGRARKVRWIGRKLERLCKKAGVPRVCTHSLRGMQASVALQAGATPHQVAAVLGHESPSVTLRHYATPESQREREGLARVLTLRGGKS